MNKGHVVVLVIPLLPVNMSPLMSRVSQLILLVCLLGDTSLVLPMRVPRRAGYSSKSEEVPQMAAIYGYSPLYLQLYQQQQPSWPQHQAQLWPPQTQQKPGQTPMVPQANTPVINTQPTQHLKQPSIPVQHQAKLPTLSAPAKKPQPGQLPTDIMQSQIFPQFGNVLNPYQIPWLFPQMHLPGGFPFNPYHNHIPHAFGRPPSSNEEGVQSPYLGYYGFGRRPPYFSEELEPEEAANAEVDSPKPEPTVNTTATINSTTGTLTDKGREQDANATSVTSQNVNEGHSQNPEANPVGQSMMSPTTIPGGDVSVQRRIKTNHEPFVSNNRILPPNSDHNLPIVQRKQATKDVRASGPREFPPFFQIHSHQTNTQSNTFAPKGSDIHLAGQRASLQQGSNLYSCNNRPTYSRFNPSNTDRLSYNPRKGSSGQPAKAEFPSNNLIDQKRNSPFQRYNLAGYRTSIPQRSKFTPSLNSFRNNENSPFQREETVKIHTGEKQQFPEGMYLKQRNDETNAEKQPLDDNVNKLVPTENNMVNREHLLSPGAGLSVQREHSPHQELDLPVQRQELVPANNNRNHEDSAKDFDPRPPHPHNTSPFSLNNHFHEQERDFYIENNHYDLTERSPHPRSSAWEYTRTDLSPLGNHQNVLHLQHIPSVQRQGNWYYENDPIGQVDNMFYPGSHSWDQRRNFQAFEVSQSKQDKYDKYSSYKGENPINHLYEGESQNYNPHEDEYSMYPLGPADNQNYPLYNGKNTKFPSYTGENQNLFQHESGYTNYRPYSEGHSEFSTYREANSKYTPYNPPEQQGNVYYSVDRIYNVGEHSPYDVLPPWNEGNRSPNINLEPPGNEANLPYPSSGPMRNTFSHQINPYEVAHPWETKDNGLVYGKEHPKNYENTRYHSGAPFVQREALLYPTGNSWDSGNHIPVHRESPTHAQTQLWDSNVDKHIRGPTEISPHTGGYPTDPRRVPSHSKGAMWNYGESQIAGFSSLEQRYHGKTVSGSEGNPTVYREAARDLSLNPLCCKGNFPVTSENAFPKNDDSPYISLPLWEKQERISYHVNSHSKHARHVEYTSGIEASQGNNSSLTDGQVTGMEEMMLPLKVEKLTEEGGGARYNNHSSQGGERSSNAETDATKLESGYFPGQNIVADVHNATAPRLQENKFVRRNKVTVSIPRKVCAGSANARHGISRGASPEGTKKKYVSTNNYMEQSPKQTLRRVLCFKGKLSSMSVDDKNTSALDHTLNPLPAEQSLPTRKPTVRLNSTRKSILPAMVKQDIPHSSNSPSGKTPQAKERTSGYKASEMYP